MTYIQQFYNIYTRMDNTKINSIVKAVKTRYAFFQRSFFQNRLLDQNNLYNFLAQYLGVKTLHFIHRAFQKWLR